MDIADCMRVEEIRLATIDDEHLGLLSKYVLCVWPCRVEIQKLQLYWSFRDEIANIDGIVIKDTRIILLESLQNQALRQLHMYHMGIEKTRLPVCKSLNWENMNVSIEDMIQNYPTLLDFHVT